MSTNLSITTPVVCQFESTTQIRIIMIDGNPWFVAKDICDALSIKNPSDALKALDKDERARLNLGRSEITGGGGETNIINESGMYALVMRSRDAMKEGTPQHKFRKWVTSEVLPTIRKTGKYEAPKPVAPQPLGEVATWVMKKYVQSLERYLNRSGNKIGSVLYAHVKAKFGVTHVQDIPTYRFDELLSDLEDFYDQSYALWQVCERLELALLQTKYKAQYETKCEIPPIIQQAMLHKLGEDKLVGGVCDTIRQEAQKKLKLLC